VSDALKARWAEQDRRRIEEAPRNAEGEPLLELRPGDAEIVRERERLAEEARGLRARVGSLETKLYGIREECLAARGQDAVTKAEALDAIWEIATGSPVHPSAPAPCGCVCADCLASSQTHSVCIYQCGLLARAAYVAPYNPDTNCPLCGSPKHDGDACGGSPFSDVPERNQP